jgi:ADP-ribose pyrophosphatase
VAWRFESYSDEGYEVIPPHAHRVFEGELFDIYQWNQELYDGSKALFERAKRKTDTVQIIAACDEGIVLIDESQPDGERIGSLPGGRIEPGEEPLEAARRELLEETGFEAGDLVLFKTYDRFPKLEWKVYYYLAIGCEKTREPAPDAGERISVRIVAFEAFLEEFTAEGRDDGAFTADMLRSRFDAGEREAFRSSLFGS